MARNNYSFEKRQRELAKKKKKEEKREQRRKKPQDNELQNQASEPPSDTAHDNA